RPIEGIASPCRKARNKTYRARAQIGRGRRFCENATSTPAATSCIAETEPINEKFAAFLASALSSALSRRIAREALDGADYPVHADDRSLPVFRIDDTALPQRSQPTESHAQFRRAGHGGDRHGVLGAVRRHGPLGRRRLCDG